MENRLEYENKRRKENKFNLQCDKCSNIPNFTFINIFYKDFVDLKNGRNGIRNIKTKIF